MKRANNNNNKYFSKFFVLFFLTILFSCFLISGCVVPIEHPENREEPELPDEQEIPDSSDEFERDEDLDEHVAPDDEKNDFVSPVDDEPWNDSDKDDVIGELKETDNILTMLEKLARTDVPESVSDIPANYFVSPNGNDDNTGHSPGAAWRTLGKVNSFSFKPGDVIAFERGGKWYGALNIAWSGTEGNEIIFTAYGSGEKPVIHGWRTLTGWVSEGNGLYSVTDTSFPNTINMIVLNGERQSKGRYPKAGDSSDSFYNGWHPISSASGTTSITSNILSGSPNYAGAEIVVTKTEWLIDIGKIVSHNGGSLTISGLTAHGVSINPNYGFFIQNHVSTLTEFGDWMYDDSAKKLTLYFGDETPENHEVKVSGVDYLVLVRNKKHIVFNNIRFEGPNIDGVHVSHWGAEAIEFHGCEFKFSGRNAITAHAWDTNGEWVGNPNNLVVDRCLFENTASSAIKGTHLNGITITDNVIRNTYLDASSLVGDPIGVGGTYAPGGGYTIIGNRIYFAGSHGISFTGSDVLVDKNIVYHWAKIHTDVGGIYLYAGEYEVGGAFDNRIISRNIVVNDPDYVRPLRIGGMFVGIYHDEKSRNVVTKDNLIMHSSFGIFGHGAHDIECKRNLMYKNKYHNGIGFGMSEFGSGPFNNWDFRENTVYDWGNAALWFRYNEGSSIRNYGLFDNNYYIKPGEGTYVHVRKNWNYPDEYTLAQFQSSYGYELNSKTSPTTSVVSDVYANPNKEKTLVVNIGTNRIDKEGNRLDSLQTLKPFEFLLVLEGKLA